MITLLSPPPTLFRNIANLRQNNGQRVNTNNSISNSKLAPLNKDTVSFTGVVEYKAAINNFSVCQSLHENAKPAAQYLSKTIQAYFEPYEYDKKRNPKGTVILQNRVKTPRSIEEKVADKIDGILKLPKEEEIQKAMFSPYDENSIKGKIKDIVGSRIIMRQADNGGSSEVADTIATMILEEGLIIDEIENHVPVIENTRPYFTEEDLQKIKDAADQVRFENGMEKLKEIHVNPNPSGYMALHLDVNLSVIGKLAKYRNYHGEIQVIGSDVAMLKDIEDYCYKLKKGKSITLNNRAYTPLEDFFLEAWNDKENYPNLKEDFEKYTKMAYGIQRNRPVTDNNEPYLFPTIEECGLEGKIPPMLDFNILAKIREHCMDLREIEKDPKKVLDEITKEKKRIAL